MSPIPERPFHIVKSSRIYNGHGYQGRSSGNVLMEFFTLAEANEWRERVLMQNNGVGWDIYYRGQITWWVGENPTIDE